MQNLANQEFKNKVINDMLVIDAAKKYVFYSSLNSPYSDRHMMASTSKIKERIEEIKDESKHIDCSGRIPFSYIIDSVRPR